MISLCVSKLFEVFYVSLEIIFTSLDHCKRLPHRHQLAHKSRSANSLFCSFWLRAIYIWNELDRNKEKKNAESFCIHESLNSSKNAYSFILWSRLFPHADFVQISLFCSYFFLITLVISGYVILFRCYRYLCIITRCIAAIFMYV